MPVDVESELARLGSAWSESVAHVDVAEVLERTMTTGSQPIDDMVDLPATRHHLMRAEPRSRRSGQRWLVAAACAALVVAGVVAVAQRPAGGPEPAATNTAAIPSSLPTNTAAPLQRPEPFVGVWASIDTDGSSQTLEIVRSGADEYEFVVRGDSATACSGDPATMTGTGLLETDDRLVIAQPDLTCDDGTVPRIGLPPQAELANFTLELDTAADELVDNFGIVWRRAGPNDEEVVSSPVTGPPSASATSGGMWPQSTLDEVRAAQELADAGKPAYAWQLDATLAAGGEPWGAEIFARFIEEELGWEQFISSSSFQRYGYAGGEGSYGGVLFIRCAPGRTNPLSPLYAAAPAEVRRCAPTIDELTYETVSFNVTQPERRSASGIWVVDRWEILQPKSDPGSLETLLYPDYLDQSQAVQQVVPPSDTEVTALLEAFLGARVDGEGAEQYLLREPEESPFEDREVPLLYATTRGAPYERSEIERLQGPVWPNGSTEYKVRLYAEGETVVEQRFHVIGRDGQLGLVYGYASNDLATTENGQIVAVPYSLLDGEITFAAAPPWYGEFGPPTVMSFGVARDHVVIATDPLPVEDGCENGPAPADAEALAGSIMANPEFETTDTVPVSIAGIDGLQIDGVVTAQWDTNWSLCYPMWITNASVFRIRLYLIDYPDESAQVLTIAVIAPEPDFERVLDETTPIVESVEFRLG